MLSVNVVELVQSLASEVIRKPLEAPSASLMAW